MIRVYGVFSFSISKRCYDYSKSRKKSFNPEGVTEQTGVSVSSLRNLIYG
ncbi:MAG: hypothetical protein JETT_2877 [Candidatus Jettenia ecosi]|uniref:Uncharacterized protein n=1 Tax=Candidatus Jettenia ecosi TaxID=2494326 RepID=A0A533Q871_9BACT|nr:MAG: hypothetical protein JETT_2877 [Candidatus Jettenia ecosi]